MFKDLPEGKTHSFNDGCGELAHNMPNTNCCSKCLGIFRNGLNEKIGERCHFPGCPCHDKPGWEESFEERFSAATFTWKDLFFANQAKSEVKSFIANLLIEAEKRGFEIGMIRDAERDKELKEEGFKEAVEESKKFISSWHIKKGGYTELAYKLKAHLLKGKEKL